MRPTRLDPLPSRLTDAILSLQPTACWPLDDGTGPLRDVSGRGWHATVTGSPLYRVAARAPVDRGVAWSGSGQYAAASTSTPVPTASVSVLALFSTTDATAANRYLASRGASGQYSWGLYLASNHTAGALAFQAAGGVHATVGVSGAVNDGAWHLAGMTFDGTTLRAYRDGLTNSSTSLTGSWHLASTGAPRIAAHGNAASLWVGTESQVAYWADRVVTAADFRWLHSIAAGG